VSRLAAIPDALLPGDGAFPPASALGLAEAMAAHPRFAPTADRIAAAAEGVEAFAPEARAARLRAIEAAHPEGFGALVVAACSLYYTHAQALAAVERETGYKAGPPQPGGCEPAPFDEALLAGPRARAKRWRDAP